jgi:hypothetical protein
MSNFVQGLVWNAAIPHSDAKIVAVKLADWADDDGGSIFPAAGTVAGMCSLARSSVCKWQYALEYCGLLKVLARSQGGSRDDTTERAFDLELLKRISWSKVGKKKVEPELRLALGTTERQVIDRKSGKPKTVKTTVFEVIPFAEDTPVAGAAKGVSVAGAPVRGTDGSEEITHPQHGRVPIRGTDSSRPRGGHEPSGIHQGNPSPPQPPARRGEGGWLKLSLLKKLHDEGEPELVLRCFLGKLLRAGLKPWSECDPSAVARQICTDLADETSEVLERAAGILLGAGGRKYVMPPVSECHEAVAKAKAQGRARDLERERAKELCRQRDKAIEDEARIAYRKFVKQYLRERLAEVDPESQRAWESEFETGLDASQHKFFSNREWYQPFLWAEARPFLEAKLGVAMPSEQGFVAEAVARAQAKLQFEAPTDDVPLFAGALAGPNGRLAA